MKFANLQLLYSSLRAYFVSMTNDVRLITFSMFPLNEIYNKKLILVYFYISQYELKRQQLIEENQKLLKELGLGPENDLTPKEMKQFKVYRKKRIVIYYIYKSLPLIIRCMSLLFCYWQIPHCISRIFHHQEKNQEIVIAHLNQYYKQRAYQDG